MTSSSSAAGVVNLAFLGWFYKVCDPFIVIYLESDLLQRSLLSCFQSWCWRLVFTSYLVFSYQLDKVCENHWRHCIESYQLSMKDFENTTRSTQIKRNVEFHELFVQPRKLQESIWRSWTNLKSEQSDVVNPDCNYFFSCFSFKLQVERGWTLWTQPRPTLQQMHLWRPNSPKTKTLSDHFASQLIKWRHIERFPGNSKLHKGS